jgi:hypothetical protein
MADSSVSFCRCYNALFHITLRMQLAAANLRLYIRVLSCGEARAAAVLSTPSGLSLC